MTHHDRILPPISAKDPLPQKRSGSPRIPTFGNGRGKYQLIPDETIATVRWLYEREKWRRQELSFYFGLRRSTINCLLEYVTHIHLKPKRPLQLPSRPNEEGMNAMAKFCEANLKHVPRRWQGRSAIVAGSGRSLPLSAPLVAPMLDRGAVLVAVNDAYRILPPAHVLYATDTMWWWSHKGAPDFAGERWATHSMPNNDKSVLPLEWCINYVRGQRSYQWSKDSSVLSYGSLSGFSAINFALLSGCNPIYLIGFDMHGLNFFGLHPNSLRNNDKRKMIDSFDQAARQSLSEGWSIINCTPGTALEAFPIGELPTE